MCDALPDKQEIIKVLESGVTTPAADEYQVGLVLGGTVSAGAYTAGFLDKLIEALDAWHLAKDQTPGVVPPHKVKLRIATGASGGAVCAAILARALRYRFPHVSPTSDPATWDRNPFYSIWVKGLDARNFLDTADLDGDKPLASLLNAESLGWATTKAAAFTGDALPGNWGIRPYVDNPFRVVMTLGNLTGVPYRIDFGNGVGQNYLAHADHVRFACDIGGPGPGSPRPDEFLVQEDGTDQAVNWLTLASYARASGAFPLGFPPRGLTRPRQHYAYRAAVIPDDNGGARIEQLKPAWPQGAGKDYALLAVDGGTFNNEPIELARTYLAGLTGRNPRKSKEARRGVVLVDPLPSVSSSEPDKIDNLIKLGGATISSMVNHGRYSTADLMMMADPSVFSRFLVVPDRNGITGELAIATAGLGAFLGFFEEDFRRHDYMLGRANCQKFLDTEFALADTNPIFANWTPAMKSNFRGGAGAGFLPIIPLVGRAAAADGPIPWPAGKLTAKQVRKRAARRVDAIVQKVLDDAIDFPLSDIPVWALKGAVAAPLLDMIEEQAAKDLAARKL